MQEGIFINPDHKEYLRFLESTIEKELGLTLTINKKTETGVSNEVHEATLDNKIVFIKKYESSSSFEGEVFGYDLLRAKGIPVPMIITSREHPPTIGSPVAILSSVEGTTIKDSNLSEEEQEIIYEDLGALLRKIHEIKLEGFGKPTVVEGKLRGAFSTYEEYRRTEDINLQESTDFLLQQGLLNTDEEEKFKKVREEILALDFGPGSLLHGDLHDRHVFITNDLITGIIDIGGLKVGDPRFDIAMCLHFIKNEKVSEAFKKGYGELANDPVVKKYLIIIILRKIKSRFNRTKEIKRETIESLHQLLAEL